MRHDGDQRLLALAALDGQPDSHFSPFPHPFGEVVGMDALAEAATFIIRKTVIHVLKEGAIARFKDRQAREDFWLYEYGLNNKQSKKRLEEMANALNVANLTRSEGVS